METRFEFVNPEFFWLFLLLPLLGAWYYWKRNRQTASLQISSIKGFEGSSNWLAKLRPVLFVLRLAALSLLIVALARPRDVETSSKIKKTEGIDIVMSVDISASMLARDLKPNRLEALKKVATNFVEERPNDRIGVVIYSGESYTQTPITSDKNIVKNAIENIEFSNTIEGGTAIGMGLATAVNRLKESKAKSKVIILLTDGENNTGFIDPKIATELAVSFNIKVYTIGIGSKGMAQAPVALNPNGSFRYANVQVNIDETLLQDIAKETDGKYFRATSTSKLEEIYEEINKLEKTEIEETKYTNYEERYRPFAIWAGILLLLEAVFRFTFFRSFI